MLLARRSIAQADVVVVVIDALAGATDQDAAIAGEAAEAGRGIVVAINKWDLVEDPSPEKMRAIDDETRRRLPFLDFAPIIHISALTGAKTPRLLELIDRVALERRRRVPTPELNRFIAVITAAQPPVADARRAVRVLFAAQTGVAPPTFVLFTNIAASLHFSYMRYLTNRLRDEYGFEGSPIRLHVRRRARARKEDRRTLIPRAIVRNSAGSCPVARRADHVLWSLRSSSGSRPRTSVRSPRCNRTCCAPGRRSSRILASRRPAGPRIYGRADVERVLRIRELVFVEGLTLAGARRRLEETEPDKVSAGLEDLVVVNEATRTRIRDVRQGLQGVLDLLNRSTAGGSFELVAAAPAPNRPRRQDRPEGEAFGVIVAPPTGCSAAWLARLLGVQEVPGSNPGIPTNLILFLPPRAGRAPAAPTV